MKLFALLCLMAFSFPLFADLADIQKYNSSYVANEYLQYLANSQVSGFVDTQIVSGQSMTLCGEASVLSDEQADEMQTVYVSIPVCLLDGVSTTPVAYLISECFMSRVRYGKFSSAIRASCQIVNGRSY